MRRSGCFAPADVLFDAVLRYPLHYGHAYRIAEAEQAILLGIRQQIVIAIQADALKACALKGKDPPHLYGAPACSNYELNRRSAFWRAKTTGKPIIPQIEDLLPKTPAAATASGGELQWF